MSAEPLISVILATHNRRDVVLATIGRVLSGSVRHGLEIIVVDNASRDGTSDAVERRFPTVRVVRSPHNLGSCGKSLGVPQARGRWTVFLDDDSYPRPGSLDRMVEHFNADASLGAAAFRVHLPGGLQESAALPDVFVGCGVGFRAHALREVGGLDPDLFMQAEEYHLAFRLVNAGWRIRRFDDLHVDHLKSPCARRTARTLYFDTRNNLLAAARYLPPPYDEIYASDWRQRYAWMAGTAARWLAYARGCGAAFVRSRSDRARHARARLSPIALETLFRLDLAEREMRWLGDQGLRRIVLVDLGKNVYAFHRAAQRAELTILAIADDRFARAGREYRGTSIVTLDRGLAAAPDAFVVANMSPVHAEAARRRLIARTPLPVFEWFSRPLPALAPRQAVLT
jgi:GT2 family glycosyltransferase